MRVHFVKAQNGRRDADPRETAKSGGVLLAPPMRPHPCQHGGLLIDQSASGERRLLAKRPCHEEIEKQGAKTSPALLGALSRRALVAVSETYGGRRERETHTKGKRNDG